MSVDFSGLRVRYLGGSDYLGSEIPPPPFEYSGRISSSVQAVIVIEEAKASSRM